MKIPKILLYDIEIAHSYNSAYQKRMYTGWIDKGVRMSADISFITHFGYMWKGGKAHCKSLHEFSEFKNGDIHNDAPLVKFASEIFQEADHLVAHYGDKFDRRYMNAKLLEHHCPVIPPAPMMKQSDTCALAKRHIKMSSNRLDVLAEFLKVPMKLKKNWPDDWLKMTEGNVAAYKRVQTYCKGDVISLDGVHMALLPFDVKMPNRSFESQTKCCPVCASEQLTNHGYRVTKTRKYMRYYCTNCGSVRDSSQCIGG